MKNKFKTFSRGFAIFCMTMLAVCAFSTPARAIKLNDIFAPVTKQADLNSQTLKELNKALTFSSKLFSFKRERIIENIFRYSFILKVGPGDHDQIGIYRVIKETLPGKAPNGGTGVMLLHGGYANFESFLTAGTTVAQDKNLAVYLAKKDVDVWGIDLRWALVPESETDFSFMKNWDLRTHLNDIHVAVKFARVFRRLGGIVDSKLFLLGHSQGGQLCYLFASDEARNSKNAQDIKGIIPIDASLIGDPKKKEIIEPALGRYQVAKGAYNAGIYSINQPLVLKYIAQLSLLDPNGASPIIPGYSNEQAGKVFASATWTTFLPPEGPYTPFYHYNAANFDASNIPSTFIHTNYSYLLEYILNLANYQSLKEIVELEAMLSGAENLPYDDNLKKIKIPVLYVGAAGGEGEYGKYTLSLLGSSDIKSLIIRLNDPLAVYNDYGHLDLLTADDANTLVWQPIYQWLKSHEKD